MRPPKSVEVLALMTVERVQIALGDGDEKFLINGTIKESIGKIDEITLIIESGDKSK